MQRTWMLGFLFCFLGSLTATAQDEVFSGPQPGEEITKFKVLQVKSPDETEELELGPNDEGVTLFCFMHKLTEPALGLFINVEFYADKLDGIDDQYIFLTDDANKMESQVKKWSERSFFQTAPMCISLDGPEGPGEYGLNRNVTATVVLAKGDKVIKNFAFQDPNPSDSESVMLAIAETLELEKPSFEEIRTEMRAMRDERRKMRMSQNPVMKLAPNERLGTIMMRMMFTEGDREENAKLRTEQLLEWAGDSEERMQQLKDYCKKVLEAEIETNDFSRQALKEIIDDES